MNLRPELLLHPNIPKPLHGLAPRTILGQTWWDMVRQEAYAKTEYRCAACGVHKAFAKYHQWLEAHEFYKIDYALGRMEMTEICALCHSCHNYIHSGRLMRMVQTGQATQKKLDDIISHGDKIIFNAGLTMPDEPQVIAAWSDWRLILYGKEYPPLWRDRQEWMEHYFKP